MKTIKQILTLVSAFSLMFTSLNAQDLKVNSKFIEKTYNLNVEDTFEIKIKSNRTTGAVWHLVNACEGGIVEQIKHDYVPDPIPEGWAGVGGNDILILKAIKSGIVILKFELIQSWMPNKIEDVKFFKVNVSDTKYDFEIFVNESFEIAIPANHSTPYRWAWLNESDVRIVEKTDYKYISDPAPKGLVGGGGTEHWTLKAFSPGEVVLKFVQTFLGDLDNIDLNSIANPNPIKTYNVKVTSKTLEPTSDSEITLENVSVSTHPPIPSGLKATFIKSTINNSSSTCQVIKDLTYWAYSYLDNRYSFGIVGYDNSGKVIYQKEKKGARYLSQIKLNPENRTIDFIGQAGRKVTMDWDEILEGNPIDEYIEVPFAVVENVPIYPGCDKGNNAFKKSCMSQKIAKFVQKKNNTKELARELGLTGRQRINVIFKIDQNGNITSIKIRAPHPGLEKEVARVINMLPKMKPGMHKGKVVIVPYSLPIVFQVQD